MCTDSKRHFFHRQEDMEDDNILFHYPFVNFDYPADVISQLISSRKQASFFNPCLRLLYFSCNPLHLLYPDMKEISATGNTRDFYSLKTFFSTLLKKVFRVVFNPTMQSSGCAT
jgi:hypothetical protein